MVLIPNLTLLDILAELIDTGELLETVALRLLATATVPGPNTVWADLQESAFSGYSPLSPAAWGAPFLDTLGNVMVQTVCHQFIQNATTVSEVAYGWALTTGTTPIKLRAAELFDTPVTFDAIGRAIQVSGRLPLAAGPG